MSENTKWKEIDARGPNDSIRFLWNGNPDPSNSRFKIKVPGPDGLIETPELPYEEARQDFIHPNVSLNLGTLTMANTVDVTIGVV